MSASKTAFQAAQLSPQAAATAVSQGKRHPNPAHAADELHHVDRRVVRLEISSRELLHHLIMDVPELLKSGLDVLVVLVVGGPVPKVLLLLDDFGWHIVGACNEPISDLGRSIIPGISEGRGGFLKFFLSQNPIIPIDFISTQVVCHLVHCVFGHVMSPCRVELVLLFGHHGDPLTFGVSAQMFGAK
jgi:hypothetical protein